MVMLMVTVIKVMGMIVKAKQEAQHCINLVTSPPPPPPPPPPLPSTMIILPPNKRCKSHTFPRSNLDNSTLPPRSRSLVPRLPIVRPTPAPRPSNAR
ncbi:hypothetical protein E2C01_081733 [Portunus trituberculatus]|uniref:Uncharacterized protein n=1 Tax=Portunus trituberculatus TaxID=210409 RepID=A0A5B7IWP3_PORTR|nr:hypothetical protein [Portunus trituberculatus]